MPSLDLPSGIRIRYDDRGPRGVPAIVLAHGFGVSLEMWCRCARCPNGTA